MKRKWDLIRAILGEIEANSLRDYIVTKRYLQDAENQDEVLGHLEILLDAGILQHAIIERRPDGSFGLWDCRGIYLTMQGHDLLEALNSDTVWNAIKRRAEKAGTAISWELIKAAIPEVLRELIK